MCATTTSLTSRTCGRAHVRRFAAEAARPGSKGSNTTKKEEDEEEWVDPPHIAEAKQRLRTFEKEDLYAVLGVAPDVDSEGIITAYNERGAALASAPDFSTNAELKAQLQRLQHATEVLLDPPQRLEFDAQRRSVHEALRRLEVDPKWARGKVRMVTVGRTFLFTKQVWAFGVFLAMMGVFTYIAIDFARRKEEQLKRHDRATVTRKGSPTQEQPHRRTPVTPPPAAAAATTTIPTPTEKDA